MRKFICVAMSCLLCGMLAACDSDDAKIGVMDMNRLLQESAPGKAGIKYIEQQQAALQKRMEDIQAKLEKNPKDESAQRELQKLFMEAQQQVQTDGQAVVGALLDAIQNVAEKFRVQNGYMAIMRVEALDAYDPKLDVTNAVMQEVNKLKLDFKSILAAQDDSAAEDEEKEAKTESAPAKEAEKNPETRKESEEDKPDAMKPDSKESPSKEQNKK